MLSGFLLTIQVFLKKSYLAIHPCHPKIVLSHHIGFAHHHKKSHPPCLAYRLEWQLKTCYIQPWSPESKSTEAGFQENFVDSAILLLVATVMASNSTIILRWKLVISIEYIILSSGIAMALAQSVLQNCMESILFSFTESSGRKTFWACRLPESL